MLDIINTTETIHRTAKGELHSPQFTKVLRVGAPFIKVERGRRASPTKRADHPPFKHPLTVSTSFIVRCAEKLLDHTSKYLRTACVILYFYNFKILYYSSSFDVADACYIRCHILRFLYCIDIFYVIVKTQLKIISVLPVISKYGQARRLKIRGAAEFFSYFKD